MYIYTYMLYIILYIYIYILYIKSIFSLYKFFPLNLCSYFTIYTNRLDIKFDKWNYRYEAYNNNYHKYIKTKLKNTKRNTIMTIKTVP